MRFLFLFLIFISKQILISKGKMEEGDFEHENRN